MKWDEALLTMSVGEQATITIEAEWAYGAKGLAYPSFYLILILMIIVLDSVRILYLPILILSLMSNSYELSKACKP